MTDPLQHEVFTAQLNTIFRFQLAPDKEIETELVEVSDLKMYGAQQQFSVTFRGPNEVFLDQGMRHCTHDQMGEFDLFLVPISKDPQGFNYEAIFNRLPLQD